MTDRLEILDYPESVSLPTMVNSWTLCLPSVVRGDHRWQTTLHMLDCKSHKCLGAKPSYSAEARQFNPFIVQNRKIIWMCDFI